LGNNLFWHHQFGLFTYVVCYERVCYEHGLFSNLTVVNVVCYEQVCYERDLLVL